MLPPAGQILEKDALPEIILMMLEYLRRLKISSGYKQPFSLGTFRFRLQPLTPPPPLQVKGDFAFRLGLDPLPPQVKEILKKEG